MGIWIPRCQLLRRPKAPGLFRCRRCRVLAGSCDHRRVQISPVTMRIETELPVWPTEKCRQNGAHRIYRRTLSSSIAVEDLATLPGNTKKLGPISRKLLILKLDGGRGGIRTPDTLSGTPVFKTGAINHSATLPYSDDKSPRHSPPNPGCTTEEGRGRRGPPPIIVSLTGGLSRWA